jgi:PadR family transcriptional regulator PadR
MANSAENELKKGSGELLILSIVAGQPRHGYEIAKLIDVRSEGTLHFHAASLYPLLYRLEKRGFIQGQWVEKANQRRRRYYRLTAEGKESLAMKRLKWQEFAVAVARIVGVEHA